MIKEGDDVIGFKQQIKMVKNKVAAPFQVLQEDIIYGKGVDNTQGLVEALVFEGVLEKAGSWFKYEGVNIAQGMKKLRVTLEENPDLLDKLKSDLSALRK